MKVRLLALVWLGLFCVSETEAGPYWLGSAGTQNVSVRFGSYTLEDEGPAFKLGFGYESDTAWLLEFHYSNADTFWNRTGGFFPPAPPPRVSARLTALQLSVGRPVWDLANSRVVLRVGIEQTDTGDFIDRGGTSALLGADWMFKSDEAISYGLTAEASAFGSQALLARVRWNF